MSDLDVCYLAAFSLAYVPPARFQVHEMLWISKPTLEASFAALEELTTLRLALLPAVMRIVTSSVDGGLPGRSKVLTINQTGRYEGQAATPWTTLSLRFASARYYETYDLEGVPRGIRHLLRAQPPGAWRLAFDRYVEAIKRHCVIFLPASTQNGVIERRKTIIRPVESVRTSGLHARNPGPWKWKYYRQIRRRSRR
jgi:hypothetical protein